MSSTAAFATFDVEPKASGGGNGGLLAAAKFKSKEKLEAANEDAVAAMERQEKHVLFYRGKNLTQTIFMLLDEPESSYAARLISVGILLLIVISSVTFVSETHPHVRNDEDTLALIQTLETVCIGVFTTEYLLRVATCRERPRKNQSILKYMRNPMNVIDLLSILPFYVELILTYIKSDTDVSKLAVVRMLRMSRLFRVLKFGGYADDLQLFVEGFRRSSEGLAVLGFLLALYLCVGGSILYMLEEPAQRAAARGGFESIPSAWYFVVASMTTVGYGDQYPITPEGKMFCSVVMLCGIFVLGLPIVIIGHSFEEVFGQEAELKQKRKDMMAEKRSHNRGPDPPHGAGGPDATESREQTMDNPLATLSNGKAEQSTAALSASDDVAEIPKGVNESSTFDPDTAILNMCEVLDDLYEQTGDSRLQKALEQLLLPKDE